MYILIGDILPACHVKMGQIMLKNWNVSNSYMQLIVEFAVWTQMVMSDPQQCTTSAL